MVKNNMKPLFWKRCSISKPFTLCNKQNILHCFLLLSLAGYLLSYDKTSPFLDRDGSIVPQIRELNSVLYSCIHICSNIWVKTSKCSCEQELLAKLQWFRIQIVSFRPRPDFAHAMEHNEKRSHINTSTVWTVEIYLHISINTKGVQMLPNAQTESYQDKTCIGRNGFCLKQDCWQQLYEALRVSINS